MKYRRSLRSREKDGKRKSVCLLRRPRDQRSARGEKKELSCSRLHVGGGGGGGLGKKKKTACSLSQEGRQEKKKSVPLPVGEKDSEAQLRSFFYFICGRGRRNGRVISVLILRGEKGSENDVLAGRG